MLFEFYPWKIDIDIEKTKEMYLVADYSIDKMANQRFLNMLTKKQKFFFDSIGVDPLKIEIEESTCDFSGNEFSRKVITMMSVTFLFCGRFVAMPADQIEFYQDEELYGKKIATDLVATIRLDEENMFLGYDVDGLGVGIRFKHPILHFKGKQYEEWNCGYIYGMTLIHY